MVRPAALAASVTPRWGHLGPGRLLPERSLPAARDEPDTSDSGGGPARGAGLVPRLTTRRVANDDGLAMLVPCKNRTHRPLKQSASVRRSE